MTIIISSEEKRAIQDYFDNPERYMSESYLERFGGQLPNGAKISRKKESEETPGVIVPRCYIITDPQDATITHRIPMQNIDVDDPGTHSATRLSGEIYFHQNKDDLPKKLPENFEDYCEPPENEAEAEEEWYVTYKAGFIKLLGAPDYVLSRSKLGVFDRRIKYAVNTHGEKYYLKSDSLIERAGTAFSDECVAEGSGLYVGPSIFRSAPINDALVLMKKIAITRDGGETLDVFMEKPQQSLTSIQKEKLAKAILKQYLLQIYDAGLVHTDIKLTNICIKENRSSAEAPFIISFIDFDESFAVQNPRDTSCGTAGYMAPEFFNTYEDYTRQLDNRGISEAAYARTLRSDYGTLFSRASDVFALGTVCLAYDLLPVHSELFVLVQSMCKQAPEDRPSGDELRAALGLAPRLDETMRPMCG